MKITHLKSEGLKHFFEANVPANYIAEKVQKKLEAISKTAKIKGFRPGKIPLNILNVNYGPRATNEVINEIIDETTAKGVEEKKLKPAASPKVELGDFEEGKDFKIKFEIESLPEVVLKDLSKIKISGLKVKIQDSDVKKRIDEFAERIEETEPVKTDRKTKEGDYLIVDFQGWIDGKAIEQGNGVKDFKVKLGSGKFIKEFEQNLIGKSVGEEVKMEFKFPDEIKDSEIAGRPAKYEVKIKAIHERKKVALDDELAKHYRAKNFEEFKKDVENLVKNTGESQTFMYNKRQLLDALDKQYDFEIPATMLENEYKSIRHQSAHEGHSHGADGECVYPEDEKMSVKDREKQEKQFHAIAARRVRLGLVLTEIGNQEKITVTTDELGNALRREMMYYPGQEKQIADYYTNNAQAMMQLRAPIFEDKVMKHLLSQVKIDEKEVTLDQLEKEMKKLDDEE